MRKKERKVNYGLVFTSILLADRLSKLLFLKLGLVSLNKGFLMGVLSMRSTSLLLIILAVLVVGLFWCFRRNCSLPLLLIITGGISNLADRLIYGGVVDFVKFFWVPVFNLADLSISLGVLFAFVDLLRPKKLR